MYRNASYDYFSFTVKPQYNNITNILHCTDVFSHENRCWAIYLDLRGVQLQAYHLKKNSSMLVFIGAVLWSESDQLDLQNPGCEILKTTLVNLHS